MDDSVIYQTASFYCTVKHSQLFTGFSGNDSKKTKRAISWQQQTLSTWRDFVDTCVSLLQNLLALSTVQYTRLPCSANVFLFLLTVHETIWFIHLSPLKLDCMTTGPFIWHLASKMLIDPNHKSKTSFKSLSEGAQLVQINSHYMRGRNWPKTDTR